MKLARILGSMLVLAALIPACSSETRVDVVVGFYPLEVLTSKVSGKQLAIRNITPVGAEPHDIDLTAKDIDAMDSAKVVFYVGDGLSAPIEKAAKQQGTKAIDVLESLTNRLSGDPHFWLDPVLYKQALGVVEQELVAAFPEYAANFKSNASAFRAELDQLNDEFSSGLSNCERRSFVTAHEAFGYLARRYNLDQIAITGLDPEAEPSPARLSELRDEVRDSGATVIFTEELVSPKVAETLARETGAKIAVLSPLEGLTKDQVERGDNYLSIMRRDLVELRSALGCK